MRVVVCYYLFDVRHAAVANFGVVSIYDFVKSIVWRKVFVDEFEEGGCNVGFYGLAEWRVKPCDFSLSFSFVVMLCGAICKIGVVTTGIKRFPVYGGGVIERFCVAREVGDAANDVLREMF